MFTEVMNSHENTCVQVFLDVAAKQSSTHCNNSDIIHRCEAL